MESILLWSWLIGSVISFFPIVRALIVYNNPPEISDAPDRGLYVLLAILLSFLWPVYIPFFFIYQCQYIPWERLIKFDKFKKALKVFFEEEKKS
jgi:hypothetical protein